MKRWRVLLRKCKAAMSCINQPLSKDHHVVWIGKTRKQILLSLSGHNLHKKELQNYDQLYDSSFPFFCVVQFDLLPSPRVRNPRVKSSFSGLGWGNCLKRSCLGGRGWGKSKITSLWFCEVRIVSCAVSMTQEFVEEWLETNYLSKLKYVFERMFQNSKRMWVWCVLDCFFLFFFFFFAKETKKYFFSLV